MYIAALVGAQALGLSSPAASQVRSDREPTLARADHATARVDLPPGTSIPVTIDQDIPINKDQLGQTFPAHVSRDVTVNGNVVVPQGAPAQVKLMQSAEKNDNVTLRLSQVRVNGQTQAVNTTDARADTKKSHEGTGKKTGIGAAAGAVVGAITGAGIVKGAVVGAGGGLAWGLLTGPRKIDRDTQVEFSVQ